MNTTLEKQETQVETAQNGRYIAPDVNIYETKDSYVLEAEMPGVSKEGLDITVEGNEITIVGRQASDTTAGQPLFRERHRADYRRTFELDPVVDTTRIAARISQGVLSLTLPKAEKVKPRKISVGE
jgi:HSP20 family protein